MKTKPPKTTPETDKLAGGWIACETVPARHVRRLERALRAREAEDAAIDSALIKIEELEAKGAYLKRQDNEWFLFWENTGEGAAGPAPTLRELALLLSKMPTPKPSWGKYDPDATAIGYDQLAIGVESRGANEN